MKIYQYLGWGLIAIGCIHNFIGLILGWDILVGMATDGWWNTVERDGEINFARSALLWFLLLGFFWWLLGYLMQVWINSGKTVPKPIGWGLLLAGVATVIVLPQSGAWLFIPLGLIAVFGNAPELEKTAELKKTAEQGAPLRATDA